MSKINGTDKVLFGLRENYQKHKLLVKIITVFANIILLVYYFMFIPIISTSSWGIEHEAIWDKVYSVVNPFTTGAYILGVIVLLQYIMYDSWIIKVLISIFYGLVVFTSLIVIMGMTRIWELCIYIPHLLLITLCGMVTYRKWKAKSIEESL